MARSDDTEKAAQALESAAAQYGRHSGPSAERGHHNPDPIATPYSVTLWGSNPDETDNDDCWIGDGFTTLAEARAAFDDIEGTLLRHTPGDTCHPRVYFAGRAFVMIDGPDVHEVAANPDQRAVLAHRREAAASDRVWAREQATQAGMAFGVDGYNDAMGY